MRGQFGLGRLKLGDLLVRYSMSMLVMYLGFIIEPPGGVDGGAMKDAECLALSHAWAT